MHSVVNLGPRVQVRGLRIEDKEAELPHVIGQFSRPTVLNRIL